MNSWVSTDGANYIPPSSQSQDDCDGLSEEVFGLLDGMMTAVVCEFFGHYFESSSVKRPFLSCLSQIG